MLNHQAVFAPITFVLMLWSAPAEELRGMLYGMLQPLKYKNSLWAAVYVDQQFSKSVFCHLLTDWQQKHGNFHQALNKFFLEQLLCFIIYYTRIFKTLSGIIHICTLPSCAQMCTYAHYQVEALLESLQLHTVTTTISTSLMPHFPVSFPSWVLSDGIIILLSVDTILHIIVLIYR